MNDDLVISQLRTLRAYQRQKLADELYLSYIEGLKNALEEVNKEYDKLLQERDKLINRFILFRFILFRSDDDIKQRLNQCDSKRNGIRAIYEVTCERNVKLKEFDIETERIILAHRCEIELICGNTKLLSDNRK